MRISIAVVLIIAVLVVVAAMSTYHEINRRYQKEDGTVGTGWMCVLYVETPMGELISESDTIVIATITQSESVWNTPDGAAPQEFSRSKNYAKLYMYVHSFFDDSDGWDAREYPIRTVHTFQTDDVLKGEMPEKFTKQMGGGKKDDFFYDNGTIDREIGEQVVIFINSTSDFLTEPVYTVNGGKIYHYGEQISFEELKNKIQSAEN
ncbi:hypothetical protein [Methanolapillus africanus]